MSESNLYDHAGWRWCTAEGSREFDRLIDINATFREKLEWLEQAETLSLTLREAERSQKIEGERS